jgi:hypothetical protein
VPAYTGSDVDEHVPAHYGNQMAFELLGQGFTVIYLSLGTVPSTAKEFIEVLKTISATDTNKTDIWGIFKDKASYDFRFVTHGLLSAHDTHEVAAAKNAYETAVSTVATKEADYNNAKADNDAYKLTEGYDRNSTEAKTKQKA